MEYKKEKGDFFYSIKSEFNAQRVHKSMIDLFMSSLYGLHIRNIGSDMKLEGTVWGWMPCAGHSPPVRGTLVSPPQHPPPAAAAFVQIPHSSEQSLQENTRLDCLRYEIGFV